MDADNVGAWRAMSAEGLRTWYDADPEGSLVRSGMATERRPRGWGGPGPGNPGTGAERPRDPYDPGGRHNGSHLAPEHPGPWRGPAPERPRDPRDAYGPGRPRPANYPAPEHPGPWRGPPPERPREMVETRQRAGLTELMVLAEPTVLAPPPPFRKDSRGDPARYRDNERRFGGSHGRRAGAVAPLLCLPPCCCARCWSWPGSPGM